MSESQPPGTGGARSGMHVSIAGGLQRAVERGRERGCEALQIFCGNPRGWKLKERGAAGGGRLRSASGQRAGAAGGPVHRGGGGYPSAGPR
ncbi:MAG: hypothetical protein V5A84_02885 [Planctomycetota bacterium]